MPLHKYQFPMRDFLYLAPLQSFTDHHFRNAFQQVLGDVDRFYAPYLKMSNDGTIKSGPKIDILPANNPFETVVPQVMACNTADFLLMADYITDLGYTEINWNLGCPYPMVAKRDLGSGILDKPEKIIQIIETVLPNMNLKLGIKMRMGYESTEDILTLLPQLNAYPLTEIIVHARYGKQLYTGSCDHDRFEEIIPLCKHRLVYNGDIETVQDFQTLKKRFPTITDWMIGRGAIANPFLFEMIQENSPEFPMDWQTVFGEFLALLLDSHLQASSNDGNTLLKMKHYWEYFATGIEDGSFHYKRFKKIKTIAAYQNFISEFSEIEAE
ncbi:MAG: tRNA-dihydrouridine synthase family protein [Crocinitomicaceae bacterium]|nr:MAG: tRNA-dihydrouridine synthase family protein [Crocinitomicaceae bacterium]